MIKILDATFLIDYLNGVEDAAAYLLDHEDEGFVIPAPALAEVLVGEGNARGGDVAEARTDLSWAEVHETGDDTAMVAGKIASEIGPDGPFLAGMDGLIAAVGRQLDAPIVTSDGDLTHPETKAVVDVEEYKS